MQLLVSVRSASEAQSALSGGADIIDAKEPGNGSLGPVSTAVLAEIIHSIPRTVPFSVALGDFSHHDDVAQAIAAVPVRSGSASCYVKLGFAGISSPRRVRTLLDQACDAAIRHPAPLHVVAVAYADAKLTGSIDPERLCRVAVASGVTAVLLDTLVKSSGNLFTRMPLPALTQLVADIQQGGLMAALAGRLELKDLAQVGAARPDIVGFRGAACTGGRNGVVSRLQVQQLRGALGELHSDFLRSNGEERVLGETPEGPANLSPVR